MVSPPISTHNTLDISSYSHIVPSFFSGIEDPDFSRTVAEGIVNDERFSEAISDVNTFDKSDIENAVENALDNMKIPHTISIN